MTQLPYLLLGDGTSDEVLTSIIDWGLLECGFVGNSEFLAASQQPKRTTLTTRIRLALADASRPALLFVHRDAEAAKPTRRKEQITSAVAAAQVDCPHVAVVPVRMTEAWLLGDEAAIRRAAGNPNGRQALDLPRLRDLPTLPDPKRELLNLLTIASSKKPRLRKTFNARRARYQVGRFTASFTHLRSLAAFNEFEANLRSALGV